MGQVALGLRSLLFKAGVFFVMASLLAWALGGTLWPRAEVVDFDGVDQGGQTWFWRLVAGGERPPQARWLLMARQGDETPRSVDERAWRVVARLRVVADVLYCGGQLATDGRWLIEARRADGDTTTFPMPDRLAVEHQLARLDAGLAIQDLDTIRRQRAAVLDPETADEVTARAGRDTDEARSPNQVRE
ncbi:MAG: hypothetical protein ACYTGC_08550 [Planctomycetota bacterium]|jgi:hypothetical protein